METKSHSTSTVGDIALGRSCLSDHLTKVLVEKIQEGSLSIGGRLPTENALSERFGVSRTVVREAIAALRAKGLVETRQGSGTFLRSAPVQAAFQIEPLTRESIRKLLAFIEVRRGIEREIAALAAERRDKEQLDRIQSAMCRIDDAVNGGGDGVEEDFRFHLSIAKAAGNPYWVQLVEMFEPQLRAAVTITRANEARSLESARAVRSEHERIVAALIQGKATKARIAATDHMVQAAKRVIAADQEFWGGKGGEYARRLDQEPTVGS